MQLDPSTNLEPLNPEPGTFFNPEPYPQLHQNFTKTPPRLHARDSFLQYSFSEKKVLAEKVQGSEVQRLKVK